MSRFSTQVPGLGNHSSLHPIFLSFWECYVSGSSFLLICRRLTCYCCVNFCCRTKWILYIYTYIHSFYLFLKYFTIFIYLYLHASGPLVAALGLHCLFAGYFALWQRTPSVVPAEINATMGWVVPGQGSSSLDQGSNPWPLHWHRFLTTDHQSSPCPLFVDSFHI